MDNSTWLLIQLCVAGSTGLLMWGLVRLAGNLWNRAIHARRVHAAARTANHIRPRQVIDTEAKSIGIDVGAKDQTLSPAAISIGLDSPPRWRRPRKQEAERFAPPATDTSRRRAVRHRATASPNTGRRAHVGATSFREKPRRRCSVAVTRHVGRCRIAQRGTILVLQGLSRFGGRQRAYQRGAPTCHRPQDAGLGRSAGAQILDRKVDYPRQALFGRFVRRATIVSTTNVLLPGRGPRLRPR